MARLFPHAARALVLVLVWGSATAESLVDVYELAREADPTLRAAQSARDATGELLPQARSELLPRVTAEAQVARTRRDDGEDIAIPEEGTFAVGQTGYFTNETYAFDVRQPLYDGRALSARREARQQVAQADAQLDAARQGLRLRVADAYFAVLAAQDSLRFAEAEQAAIGRQLEEAEERFEVGLAEITALEEARARADLAEADVLTARNEVDNAYQALEEITGAQHEALYTLSPDFTPTVPDPPDVAEWEQRAATRNPDLLAAREASEAARERIQTQRAERHPNVDLFARHAWMETFGRDMEDTQIGIQVTVPLYLGGGIGSRTREAQHRFDEARDQLEGERRRVVRETRDAFRATTTTARRIQALEQAVRSASRSLEATEAGLEVGIRTMVDVLNAQRELFGARRDLANARYEHLLATLRLRAATGTLDDGDLAQVDAALEPADGENAI